MQADAVHAFHAGHRIVVAAPNRHCSFGALLDFKIHGQKRRRAMVLRPVEFDPSGNPRSGEADERGLDYMLVVNQVVTVRFVLNAVDTPCRCYPDKPAFRETSDSCPARRADTWAELPWQLQL